MNALQIDELNKDISYEDGKIFWENGKGYTSKLMKTLYDFGYRATTSGIMHYLNDYEGKKIAESYSWEGLLHKTALAMKNVFNTGN